MNTVVAKRYVALLRGINVGGAKRIAMADLRAVFESLGFVRVRTLLQSGNVVFDVPENAGHDVDEAFVRTLETTLETTLESAIESATGVHSSTIVFSAARFRHIVRDNPFADAADPSRMLITFCGSPPERPERIAQARPTDEELAPEKIVVGTDAIYQWLPDGVLKTKLPAKYTERVAPRCTARNLRTVGKILQLLEE
ncbi:uncharacterized protein (DUF1697 family) [Glaciihabitans tibetensis]|uniref:Uncharacterized protein (DUF1697 family) n=1 Tax=Glaciihabitans tibetensis TaxID=1266600 RepID=A0A2T0VIJ7_9MICO|nr:DUF1697 domain-containing protein [Glaciihabitans tibetensis]PRY70054.1 uncharacterized protein (DUF1697 family) [Glaciihabitans tibetensis]